MPSIELKYTFMWITGKIANTVLKIRGKQKNYCFNYRE